jgi:hypothetical protein
MDFLSHDRSMSPLLSSWDTSFPSGRSTASRARPGGRASSSFAMLARGGGDVVVVASSVASVRVAASARSSASARARGGFGRGGGAARGRRATRRATEDERDDGDDETAAMDSRRAMRRARRERAESRRGGGGRGDGDEEMSAAEKAEARESAERWMKILKEESVRDPEIASLLESANGDPEAVEAKIRERFETKKEKIYQERSGSTVPTLVTFREVNPFSCWIWIESHNAIAEMERPLLEEVFKAWFVLGKLGGFNAYNMQASETYDAVSFMDYSMEQAHDFSTDTSSRTFHEMSELEYKAEWARVWVDMGTADEMAFDVLVNSLIQFSREYFGLKQIIVGGENEDWTTEGSEYGNVDLMIDETFGRGPRGQTGGMSR